MLYNKLMIESKSRIKTNHLYGWLYDIFLGTALRKTRKYVADHIYRFHLYPVLDLCCGTGAQSRYINQGKIYGADIDRRILDYAKSRDPLMTFVCADGRDLPFKKDTFKSVIISFALHEKSPEMRKGMIKEVKRILKEKGKMIITDYEKPIDFPSRLGRILTYFIERLAGKEHFHESQYFYRHGGLKKFLSRNKLRVIKSCFLKLGNSRVVIGEFRK